MNQFTHAFLLIALCFASVLPASRALAQAVPPPWQVQPAPSVKPLGLRCPACECVDAEQELTGAVAEYRSVRHQIRTRTSLPTIVTLASFGAALGITAFLQAGRELSHESGRHTFRIPMIVGAVVPLTIGITSAVFWRRRMVETAPQRARYAELRLEVRKAKLDYRASCKGVR